MSASIMIRYGPSIVRWPSPCGHVPLVMITASVLSGKGRRKRKKINDNVRCCTLSRIAFDCAPAKHGGFVETILFPRNRFGRRKSNCFAYFPPVCRESNAVPEQFFPIVWSRYGSTKQLCKETADDYERP